MRKEGKLKPWMVGALAVILIAGIAGAANKIGAIYIDTGTGATLTTNGNVLPASNGTLSLGSGGASPSYWWRAFIDHVYVPGGGNIDTEASPYNGTLHIGDQNSTSIASGRAGNNWVNNGNFSTSGTLTHSAGTGTATGNTPVTLYSDTTVTNSVTTGETFGSSYTMPANTLSSNGMQLRISAAWTHAANTNATTAKLYVNGSAIGSLSNSTSGDTFATEFRIVRTSSTSASYFGISQTPSAGYVGSRGALSITPGSTMTIQISVTGSVANGDLSTLYLRVEWWPN